MKSNAKHASRHVTVNVNEHIMKHIIHKIILTLISAVILPTLGGSAFRASAQMDPDAVQPAMAELLRRHSTTADTIAKEISVKFYDSATMQIALARAYYRNNERQKTRYYLKRAMAADPKFTPAYIMYGEMYGEWNVDSAAYWYDRAIEANPKSPEGYLHYANVMARKDMDKAVAKLEELRKVLPHHNVDVEISALYNKRGDDKAAAAALENVDPNTLTMNQLAQYMQNCYWSSYYDRAMEVGEIAMKRFPENRGFNRVYAWCATKKEMYREAIANSNIWFEHAPADSINSLDYLYLGTAYIGEAQYDKAFATLQKINNLSNDYFAPQMPAQIAKTVNKNVETLKEKGDFNAAADLYSRYITAFPSTTDPAYQYYTLAQIYRSQQEEMEGEQRKEIIKKMFAVYEIIEDRYPDWSNIAYVLYTHARWTYSFFDPENSESRALPYYQKLYEVLIKKGDMSTQEKAMVVEACQYMASDAYFQKNDLTEARVWWNRILQYDPTNQAAKDALAKIRK